MRITDTEIEVDGSPIRVAKIDLTGIEGLNDLAELEGYEAAVDEDEISPLFYVNTYNPLIGSRNVETNWFQMFGSANEFLGRLNRPTRQRLAQFYQDVRVELSTCLGDETVDDVILSISELLYDMVRETNFAEQLIVHCRTSDMLIYPELENVGNRVIDNDKYTFKDIEEYYQLAAISILCKLICPIWGDIIARTKSEIDNSAKEMACVKVITPVLKQYFEAIELKVERYVEDKVITRTLEDDKNRQSRFSAAQRGWGPERFRLYVKALLLVKKMAKIDLYRKQPRCNIVAYILDCARQSLGAWLSQLSQSNSIVERDLSFVAEKSGNVSYQEHSSRITSQTADIPMVCRIGAIRAIDIIINRYQFDRDLYEEMCSFYQKNIIRAAPLDLALISIFCSHLLGGAKSLRYLDAMMMTKLNVLTQMRLAQLGQIQLLHLLAAVTPETVKETPMSNIDSRIRSVLEILDEYRRCTVTFPITTDLDPNEPERAAKSLKVKSIARQLDNLVNWIVSYDHQYNTCPKVFFMLDMEPLQSSGDLVIYDEMIMRDVCRFFLLCYEERSEE